jgi:hypothetical protein
MRREKGSKQVRERQNTEEKEEAMRRKEQTRNQRDLRFDKF